MKKLTIEEKTILQIALSCFIRDRKEVKKTGKSYIPSTYLDRDIEIAENLQTRITFFETEQAF